MRNAKREVEFLKRLQELSPVYEELMQFLVQEYLIDQPQLKAFREASDKAKLLQARLASLSNDRKIQLLEYEWTILPTERLKVTLVTATGYKEFLVEGS